MSTCGTDPRLVRREVWREHAGIDTIQLGYAADLALLDVPDNGITGLAWRLMMGSAAIPAIVACGLVYTCPESPRWFITKNRHGEAYQAMAKLRHTKVQAARDLFYAHTLLRAENEVLGGKRRSKLKELFTVRRNRNALIASEIVMFMQQFCGVNVRYPKKMSSVFTRA
jgi:sugar transport protein